MGRPALAYDAETAVFCSPRSVLMVWCKDVLFPNVRLARTGLKLLRGTKRSSAQTIVFVVRGALWSKHAMIWGRTLWG